MFPLTVFTRVPELPLRPGVELSPDNANQWAFRCLMFYATRIDYTRSGDTHRWFIRFAQMHIKTGEWRYLSIGPMFDNEGRPTILRVELESEERHNPLPSKRGEPYVAEMKFWANQSYERKRGSNQAERVEYTHCDLMRHLRDSSIQRKLIAGIATGNLNTIVLAFYRNFIKVFIDLGLIAPESIQTFEAKVATCYTDYNRPMCTMQEWTEANQAAAQLQAQGRWPSM